MICSSIWMFGIGLPNSAAILGGNLDDLFGLFQLPGQTSVGRKQIAALLDQ